MYRPSSELQRAAEEAERNERRLARYMSRRRKEDHYKTEPFWREALVLLTVVGLLYWALFEVAIWLIG